MVESIIHSVIKKWVSIPYRVHAIGLWGQPFAIAAVVSEVSIPYRVHAIFVNADGWTAWDLFQFRIGFM